MKKIILIIIIICLGVGVYFFFIQKDNYKPFPRKEPDLYLGAWMPAAERRGVQSLEKPSDLIDLGANTVAVGLEVAYDENGNISEKAINYAKKKARDLVRKYKKAGLAVAISPEAVKLNTKGSPGEIPENLREVFLKNYNKLVIDLARICEEENVEIFSPLNEPDSHIGISLSSSWGQEILPKIKEVFSGKVMWKGSLGGLFEDGEKVIDFSGYDILGFTAFSWRGGEYHLEDMRINVEVAQKWAEEDSVPEVFNSEFGLFELSNLSAEEEYTIFHDAFLAGKGKLDGFFVFDPPHGKPIKGTNLEDIVKTEFINISQSESQKK